VEHKSDSNSTDKLLNRRHAKELMRILKEAGQDVPEKLAKYTPQSTKFADSDDDE
jgi:hypothetical protein